MIGLPKNKRLAILTVVTILACGAFVLLMTRNIQMKNEYEEDLDWRFTHLIHAAMVLLYNYEQLHNHLPTSKYVNPSGKVLGSWRFATIQYGPDYIEFKESTLDEPWDSPTNVGYATYRNPLYCWNSDVSERLDTNIFAITGPDTAFDPQQQRQWQDLPRDLILLTEIAHSHVHWMENGDLDVEHIPETITSGIDGKGVLVTFADLSTWFLHRDVPLSHLTRFFTIGGAKSNDRDKLLGPYVLFKRPRMSSR